MRAEGAPEARNPQISPNLGSDQNLGFLNKGGGLKYGYTEVRKWGRKGTFPPLLGIIEIALPRHVG